MSYLYLIIGAIFVNNFILTQFLGICPFLGVSKKTDSALGMGVAVIFVMGVASIITYAVNLLLIKWNVEYIQTIAFILVIAALVQLVEIVIKRFSPGLYNALGVYLPLITTNCAVLGVAIVNVTPSYGYNLIQAFLNGVLAASVSRSQSYLWRAYARNCVTAISLKVFRVSPLRLLRRPL